MPSKQAIAGSSPTSCKYLTGYNLIPSRDGNGKPALWKISPGNLQWRGVFFFFNDPAALGCRRFNSTLTLILFVCFHNGIHESWRLQSINRIFDGKSLFVFYFEARLVKAMKFFSNLDYIKLKHLISKRKKGWKQMAWLEQRIPRNIFDWII